MRKYRVYKKFKSSVERSDRVLECAESFGLGLQDKEFVVYDDFQLEIEQGDVVYITGQSGSGKSLLLKELAVMLANECEVANIDAVELEEKPLIDQVGNSTEEAIRILSLAGLNDAYLFIRKPSELSDGQLYRFRIAKLLSSDAKVWVADEFGAVLDRTTAKVVAFSIQKFARKLNKTVIVATTHKDLREELAPTIYVDKRFRERVEVDIKRAQDDLKG
ncbi:ABC transporter, ATP-binding protein [Vibrio coralliirubri]|uniref:ATP-binding cassette domain-containing protein n=1 Tax=Vibrio coralliirubri TaxID=1516159 RepID=UPI0006357716|nr:ATP-binding cassette domain-containing protein [Vibrio coralliirubri]CDT52787.1 ABC transporter, ATP-binding protein [Vibrio coralliirubri]